MTLKEIAAEYRKSVELIDARILQLRKELASSTAPAQCSYLEMRIKKLEPMRRDAYELASFCEHYHDRSYHSNEKYKI